MACYNRILKSGSVEIFLHFTDISHMQENGSTAHFARDAEIAKELFF